MDTKNKQHIKSKYQDHDYTNEICRCITFIVSQFRSKSEYCIKSGYSVKSILNQAIGHYGYRITFSAVKAIERHNF